MDKTALAKAWIELQYTDSNSDNYERLIDAIDPIIDMVWNNCDDCFDTCLKILELDQTDLIISNLAAGLLEDLLVENGHKILQRYIEAYQVNSTFKKTIPFIWKRTMADDVWAVISKMKN